MNKLKTFWMVFRRSITDPSYYKAVIAAPTSFSIKYLTLLIFLYSLSASMLFTVSLVQTAPQITNLTDSLKAKAYTLYPPQLVLTMKDFELSTNVKEPFIIPLPSDIQRDLRSEQSSAPQNLIVIDISATAEDFNRYDTVALLTKKSVVYTDSQNIKLFIYSDNPNLVNGTFTKATYDSILSKIETSVKFIQPVVYVLILLLALLIPVILTGVMLIGKLVLLLIWAVATWITAKVLSLKLGYGEAYRVSIHAFTPIIIPDIVKDYTHIKIPGIAMFAVFIVFVAYMLRGAKIKAASKKK